MQLQRYFDRIGFTGDARPNLDTLKRIHHKHVEAIPYENFDIQFETPVSLAPEKAYEKIVVRRRGGWCYEMNGLLAWALKEIGFKVDRLAGGVHRETFGAEAVGNHLVLLVDLGDIWLADAGFGDGLIEPIPLKEGKFETGPLRCALRKIADGWWRYHNDPAGGAPSFDFNPDFKDEEKLAQSCQRLQTDPESSFVLNAVIQRWADDTHLSMRGRIFTRLDADGKIAKLISDSDDYVATLKTEFNLNLPQAASLWPKICARHETVFAQSGPG